MNKLIEEYQRYHNYDTYGLSDIKFDHKDRIAVIVETRDVPTLRWTIDNIKYNTGWQVMLFHYENDVDDINCLKVKLPFEIDFKRYNELLKDSIFWESFSQEHILIFQSDSFMLRKGINEYLEYDLVGAPWNWANDPNFKDPRYRDLSIFSKGGNGGFSLRRKSAMLKILSDNYIDPSKEDGYINEDMFFSKYLKEYPDLDKAKNFCVETMFSENPMAVHAIDRYLTDDQIKTILFN